MDKSRISETLWLIDRPSTSIHVPSIQIYPWIGLSKSGPTMYMASKYSEKWPFWHFSSPDSIGIWTRKVACKLAILQQNHVKWLKYTQNHRLARKIVSPNSRQSRSTNIYIWSPLRVIWACVDQFWVWHESEKSVFQKTAIYFITRQRHSLVVGLSMCKISKSLMLHVHILFGVIPSTNRPKQCTCRTL